MSIRYLSNLALALLAGFLVVATQAFTLPVVAWTGFAISIVLLAIGAGMTMIQPLAQRLMGAAVVAIAAWTILASLVFAPAVAMWLIFGSAVAFLAIGIAGLTVHELRTERVVHAIEVSKSPAAAEKEFAL